MLAGREGRRRQLLQKPLAFFIGIHFKIGAISSIAATELCRLAALLFLVLQPFVLIDLFVESFIGLFVG